MRVENYSSVNSSTNSTQRNTTSQLGKEEFLKILITQLRNQDPLNPMDDRDFIAQMAQFSSLEQMQNMSSDMSSLKGLNLLGQIIYAEKYDDTTNTLNKIVGRVEQINFISGKPYIRVAGYDLEVDEVKQVLTEEAARKLVDEL